MRQVRILLVLGAVSLVQAQPIKLAMGDSHGVWLKADGSVWTWGGNGQGQLGVEGDHAYTPVRVPGLSGVRDVPAGENFSLAAGSDGSLWTWGGGGSRRPGRVAEPSGVLAVAAAGQHALAVQSGGTVWEWESGKWKRVESFRGAVAVAASARHSVALKSDGSVWVWGDHGAGDLGNGNYGVSAAPLPLRGLADIVAVAASYQLTVALKKDGTVWAVGYGAAGGLGDGAIRNSSLAPVKAAGLTGVQALAAGYMHVVALKADGTVWSWGYNHEHQLGNARLTAEESARPVRSGTLSGVVAVAAAASHSAAVTSDGSVWAWGQNDGGPLGADSELLPRSDVPMRVGQPVPEECRALFACTTAGGKVIRICGTQDESDVGKWTAIHYRFGPESGPPELLFPENPAEAAPALFFSREDRKGDSRVVVRFTNGAYTYRVYSGSKSGAGVEVTDARGRKISGVACDERPEMYTDYLRENLPCDPQNPRGAAGCRGK